MTQEKKQTAVEWLEENMTAENSIVYGWYAETSAVNHPKHYGGESNPYEAIKVIEAWNLNFNLGNVVKYISRAGKKDDTKFIQDLEKAIWYLNRELENQKK